MKIHREGTKSPLRSISIQLKASTIALVDAQAAKVPISRQKLVDLVLSQALSDPKFVLKIPG